MVYNNSKKAAQGIGTLIIFIALILVSAVAAGVLIQTASSLQSKSLDVGRQSQEKITTDIEVVQVYATDTSDGNISLASGAIADNVTIVVRLGSGSSAVKLADLLIRFDTQDGSQTLTDSGDRTFNTLNYGTTYKINGSNHQDGYLGVGDLAEISFTFNSTTVVEESETATIRLVAKNGAVKPVQITTPSAMLDVITYLYP
jgi:archaellin